MGKTKNIPGPVFAAGRFPTLSRLRRRTNVPTKRPAERITGPQNVLQNLAERFVGIDEQYVLLMMV